MNLTLTITGTPAEIQNVVSKLGDSAAPAAKMGAVAEEIATTVTKELTAAEKSKRTKAKRKKEREEKAAAEAAAAAAKEPASAEDDLGLYEEAPDELPEITLDDLKGAVRTYIEANSVDAVKAIFKRFRAAKISDVPESKYAELHAELSNAGGV